MLSTLATALLLAQAANPWLDRARALATELKFGEAITQLTVARQVPNLDGAQRAQVLELLARCHVAEGNRAEAEAAFTELLSLEPDFEIDRESTSPKIVTVFDDVKARLYPGGAVSVIEVSAPPGRVRAQVVDPYRKVTRAVLFERRGDGAWGETPLTVSARTLDFPLPRAAGVPVQWYAQLVDGGGEVLCAVGSRQAPRVVEVNGLPPPLPPPAPGLRGTTVAALVFGGAAVVAAGVGLGLQVSSLSLERAARDSTRPPGDWADTARDAHRQALEQSGLATGFFIGAGAAALTSTVLFAW
ncbi:MAG: tetratricopeptide repeat protein [Myxococcaceae bacterium]|nr:tetratricopeptide repeat protein [Myxococcaceae bacterium]